MGRASALPCSFCPDASGQNSRSKNSRKTEDSNKITPTVPINRIGTASPIKGEGFAKCDFNEQWTTHNKQWTANNNSVGTDTWVGRRVKRWGRLRPSKMRAGKPS